MAKLTEFQERMKQEGRCIHSGSRQKVKKLSCLECWLANRRTLYSLANYNPFGAGNASTHRELSRRLGYGGASSAAPVKPRDGD